MAVGAAVRCGLSHSVNVHFLVPANIDSVRGVVDFDDFGENGNALSVNYAQGRGLNQSEVCVVEKGDEFIGRVEEQSPVYSSVESEGAFAEKVGRTETDDGDWDLCIGFEDEIFSV